MHYKDKRVLRGPVELKGCQDFVDNPGSQV